MGTETIVNNKADDIQKRLELIRNRNKKTVESVNASTGKRTNVEFVNNEKKVEVVMNELISWLDDRKQHYVRKDESGKIVNEYDRIPVDIEDLNSLFEIAGLKSSVTIVSSGNTTSNDFSAINNSLEKLDSVYKFNIKKNTDNKICWFREIGIL